MMMTNSHGREIRATDGPCRAIYLGPIRKIELLANLQVRGVLGAERWCVGGGVSLGACA